MKLFDSLDLLVDLVRRFHYNVKLHYMQQLFIYKGSHKHLFEYDACVPNAKDLNKNCQLKNQRKIYIVPSIDSDINTYKRYGSFFKHTFNEFNLNLKLTFFFKLPFIVSGIF